MTDLFFVELDEKPDGGKSPPSGGPLAWEINFSADGEQAKSKKPVLPKFLRDRERPNSGISHGKQIKKDCSRTLSTYTKPTRSSSAPLKAKGVKPLAKPNSKSLSSSPKQIDLASKVDARSLSPKKSPTIKKPLLPVTSSPTKKPSRPAPAADMKSQSEVILNTSSKVTKWRGDPSHLRPHSANPYLETKSSKMLRTDEIETSPLRVVGQSMHRNERNTGNDGEAKVSGTLPVVSLTSSKEGKTRLAVTPNEMAQRKVLDLRRWYVCH